MRALVQRVSQASVEVGDSIVGKIGEGLLVFLGVHQGDSDENVEYLVRKITGLRIFPDQNGKMNLNVTDISGSLLIVSQFTLYGDTRKGMRPSFDKAARPDVAETLYNSFVTRARSLGIEVQTGIFQAEMKVSLVNNGPVTLICESAKLTPAE